MADMDYENDQRGYGDEPAYPRERSRSPRPDRDGDSRIRSASPNGRDGRDDRGPPPEPRGGDDESVNPGSNLFVTGIHPSLNEEEIQRLFEKYGEVEKCNIMRDPHTRESRGFGFVKMVTAEQADAAKNGLQGEVYEGRTLSIEKARRAKPRTPTPGKYFGPPKREDRPRGGFRGDRYGDRYDDRRGYGRRDDYGGGGNRGYRDRYEDRGYGGGGRRDRDEYAPRGYGGGREDRYSSRGEDRRGGYGYDRPSRDAPAGYAGSGAAPADPAARGTSRGYEDRGADRYERR